MAIIGNIPCFQTNPHAVLPIYCYQQKTKNIKHRFHMLLFQCHAIFIIASEKKNPGLSSNPPINYREVSCESWPHWGVKMGLAISPKGIWSGQGATLKIAILIRNPRKETVNYHDTFCRILFVPLFGDCCIHCIRLLHPFLGLLCQKYCVS